MLSIILYTRLICSFRSLQVSNRALSHCVLLSLIYTFYFDHYQALTDVFSCCKWAHFIMYSVSLVLLHSTQFFPLCVLVVNASSYDALSVAMQIFVGIKVLKIFLNALVVDIIATMHCRLCPLSFFCVHNYIFCSEIISFSEC